VGTEPVSRVVVTKFIPIGAAVIPATSRLVEALLVEN